MHYIKPRNATPLPVLQRDRRANSWGYSHLKSKTNKPTKQHTVQQTSSILMIKVSANAPSVVRYTRSTKEFQ